MIYDEPASEIPAGAVHYLRNVHAFRQYLTGRSGSPVYKEETQAQLPYLSRNHSWTKLDNIITADDAIFAATDVGKFCVHDDGTHDEIVAYLSTTSVQVRSSTAHAPSDSGWIRGAPNAGMFHKVQKVGLILLADRVYIISLDLSTYTRVLNISRDNPSNAQSKFVEFGDDAILFNSGKSFRIRLNSDCPYMWAINSEIPKTRITSAGTGTYRYKYLYSMSRLRFPGLGQDRTTPVLIEQESGLTAVDPDTGKDFGTVLKATPIDLLDGLTIGELTIPTNASSVKEKHWNMYTVYRTKDGGTAGINPINGEGNNDTQFVYVKDVPVAKAFTATRTNGIVEAIYGMFEQEDVGSVIEWENGDRDTISEYIDPQHVRIELDYYYSDNIETPESCAIGNGDVMTVSQDGNEVTISSGYTLSDSDVGSTIFMADGTQQFIVSIDGNVATVCGSSTKVSQGATMNPTYRHFHDTVRDSTDTVDDIVTLEDRIEASTDLYLPDWRFWIPFPTVNCGENTPGFLFACVRGDNKIYYSQLANRFLAGYYKPGIQDDEEIQDRIVELKVFPDRIIAFCFKSVWGTATNTSTETGYVDLGENVTKVAGFSTLESRIGCMDYGSIADTVNNNARMITNEQGKPGCRVFDGYKFGDDLTVYKDKSMNLMKRILEESHAAYASAEIDGEYIVWGIE